MKSFVLTLFLGLSLATSLNALPTVDLGYSVHQATFNETTGLYNFSNIHYANAPRFSAPARITEVNRTINDGQTPGVCPIAVPFWESLFIAHLTGQSTLAEINATFLEMQSQYESNSTSLAAQLVTEPDPIATEDCLTLDVVVPEAVWNKTTQGGSANAPVMVWIVGGGYVLGDKNAAGDPSGLIARSQTDGSDGIVYVAINYRLGLFGWTSGPQYQAEGGVSNLGLHDQRFALEWVQENIHLFGGDRNQVSIFGESAGGGSVMHQITAYGSTSGVPFQRAIPQSPAFQVMPQNDTQDIRFSKSLQWASIFNGSNVANLDQLKQLPFEVLWKVNQITTAGAYWGSFTWGPAVDGDFVPDLPGVLLSEGKFDPSIQVLTAHNSNESYLFASPLITNQDEYAASLRLLLPDASDDVISYIDTLLYPPIYNGSYPWTSQYERTLATINDAWFVCNMRYIDLALQSTAHAYFFDIAPGWHGNDLDYTFYNGQTSSGSSAFPVNESLALELQGYLTTFAKTGNPNTAGTAFIPLYGTNSTVLSLSQGIPIVDDAATERCAWWQEATYK